MQFVKCYFGRQRNRVWRGEEMRSKQTFFYNALLMTAVTLLMRTVAVGFNVYLSGKAGAEAMGLLTLVSSIYGFALTLATSGIHLATVRTVSEHMEKTGGADNRRCLLACLLYAAAFGTAASAALFAFADPIGNGLLRDARTVGALRILALSLLPVALTTVLNGYFTAVRRAYKNALSQVAAEVAKISLTVCLLSAFMPNTVQGSLLAVTAGGVAAEGFSLLLNLALYAADRRRHPQKSPAEQGPKNRLPVRVAAVAMPVAISAYMRSGLLAIEHILIPKGLSAYNHGATSALAAYGALHGMALPVVLYPAAVTAAFAGLLIPEVTRENAAENRKEIRYIAGRVYQMTLLFALGTAAVLLFLSREFGAVLYRSDEVAFFIRRLAPLVPVMYLDTATDALLKGMGQQVYSMNVNILDAFCSVLGVWLLVPRFGIAGYLVTLYFTELLNAALSISRLLRVSGYRPRPLRLLALPLLSAVGAAALSRPLFHFVFPAFGTPLALILHVLVLATFYLLLLRLTGAMTGEDLRWLGRSLCPTRRQNARCDACEAHVTRVTERP